MTIIGYSIIGIILSFLGTRPPVISCEEKKVVYLVSNGIHLDIIIPMKLLEEHFVKSFDHSVDAKYMAFGWGDKGFYLETPTWNKLKLSVAMKAIFSRSEAAMHVTSYNQVRNSWHNLSLCDEQVKKLTDYISNSFERNEAGKIMEIMAPGYTDHDTFYAAVGHFSLVKTCNSWVNIGFKQSQIQTSLWSPFDFGVLYHVRRKSKNGDWR